MYCVTLTRHCYYLQRQKLAYAAGMRTTSRLLESRMAVNFITRIHRDCGVVIVTEKVASNIFESKYTVSGLC